MFHTWSCNAMRYLGAFVTGVVMLAAIVLSAQRTWSSPETAAAPAGVSLVLSSDQSSYRSSRDIKIRCELINNSGDLLETGRGAPPFVLKLVVKKLDGSVVPPGPIDVGTELGTGIGWLGSGHVLPLTSKRFEFYELWHWGYDLRPGDYHITAYRSVRASSLSRGTAPGTPLQWVKSNTIDLTVRPWWSF